MKKIEPWVVYRMTLRGKTTGMSTVCEQSEWEAMELAQPGHHMLIRAGITSEGEAEQLARSDSVAVRSEKPAELKMPPRS